MYHFFKRSAIGGGVGSTIAYIGCSLDFNKTPTVSGYFSACNNTIDYTLGKKKALTDEEIASAIKTSNKALADSAILLAQTTEQVQPPYIIQSPGRPTMVDTALSRLSATLPPAFYYLL